MQNGERVKSEKWKVQSEFPLPATSYSQLATSQPAPGPRPPAPPQFRIFVAVLISRDVKRRIALVQEEFKKVSPEVKWVAEENFHVTLKFLGSVESGRVDQISEAIAAAAADVEPFDIEIRGAGAFPSPTRPRTVWVGVTSGQKELAELAGQIEKQMEKLGFPREDKPFRDHITIGRVKEGRCARELAPALQEAEAGRMGIVRVDSVYVMKSELRREGPIYSVLSEVRLRETGGEKNNG